MIMEYQQEIVQIKKQALEEISNIAGHEEIERLRIRYLGRKGIISMKLTDMERHATI
jgi:hypothetical protein